MPGADRGQDGVAFVLVGAFGRAELVLGGGLMIVVGRNDRVLRHHLHGLGRHGVHGMLQDVLHLLRVLLVVHLRTDVVNMQVVRVLDEGVVVLEGGLLLEVLLPELRMLFLFFFDGIVYSGVVDGGLDRVYFGVAGGGPCIVVLLVVVGRIFLLLFFLRIFHLFA